MSQQERVSLFSHVLYLKRGNFFSAPFKIWQTHKPKRAVVEFPLLLYSVVKSVCVSSPSSDKSRIVWPTLCVWKLICTRDVHVREEKNVGCEFDFSGRFQPEIIFSTSCSSALVFVEGFGFKPQKKIN